MHGQYSKMNVFGLEQYERILYLDSDTLVIENMHELLESKLTPAFSAVPEKKGLEPEFNAGLMVIEPSKAMMRDMIRHVNDTDYACGRRGQDQSFFCHYFHSPRSAWKALPVSPTVLQCVTQELLARPVQIRAHASFQRQEAVDFKQGGKDPFFRLWSEAKRRCGGNGEFAMEFAGGG